MMMMMIRRRSRRRKKNRRKRTKRIMQRISSFFCNEDFENYLLIYPSTGQDCFLGLDASFFLHV